MKLSELNKDFLFSMVQAMYAFERNLVNEPELLEEWEMNEFYMAYMGKAKV